ncbi:MAG: 50S ribosomal protein L11 methyltransferase [Nitrospirota bacterium]
MQWHEIHAALPLPLLESTYNFLWPFINGITIEKKEGAFLLKAFLFVKDPGDLVSKLKRFLRIQGKSFQADYSEPALRKTDLASANYFVIVPAPASHVPPSGIPIFIQRGRSFGIGSHPCTVYCLQALRDILGQPGRIRSVMDAGTGTGILAVAASKLGASDITAVEIVQDAVMEAVDNVKLNGAEEAVRVLHGSVTDTAGTYDLVLANLYGTLLEEIAPLLVDRISPAGWIVLGGMTALQSDRVISAYVRHGLLERSRLCDEEWCTAVLAR